MDPKYFLDNYGLIAGSMSSFHELFYKIASIGRPRITKEIKTAAVSFRDGQFLEFMFNPDWLAKLNLAETRGMICHEIKHILSNHGQRKKGLTEAHKIKLMGIAEDIVVNTNLITNFGFNLATMPFLEANGVYFHSKFEGRPDVEQNREVAYYYNLLLEEYENDPSKFDDLFNSPNGGTLDDHSYLGEIDEQDVLDILSIATNDPQLAREIVESLKNDEGGEDATAGSHTQEIFNLIYKEVKPKRKWESIFRNVRHSIRRQHCVDDYQWTKPSLRGSFLPPGLFVPSINTIDEIALNKKSMKILMDVSGSCAAQAKRFWKAAQSIPTDVFEVEFHVFDTQVEKVELKQSDLSHRINGGTAFHCIESYIQQTIAQSRRKKYPDLVVVITDGQDFGGQQVIPEIPENWYWLLIESGQTQHIPAKSKIFNLKDYE